MSGEEASTSAVTSVPESVESLSSCNGCEMQLKQFLRMSGNLDTLLEFLFIHGLLRRSVKCPKCGENCVFVKEALEFRCYNMDRATAKKMKKKAVQCNVKISLRLGTWFAGSKLDFPTICEITTYWLFINSPRQQFLMEETGCSSQTIVDWCSFCREVCLEWADRNSVKVGGEGVVVEIDEAKIGHRKYNRGRLIDGKWIFGGIERGSKRIFIVPVPERSSATLLGVIQEWILPGTTINSDCWKAYNCLEDEGFRHQTVNHSKYFVDPDTGTHTQNIERLWRDVKSKLPRYGSVDNHLAGYLAEFMFRRANPEHKSLIHRFYTEIATLYKPE